MIAASYEHNAGRLAPVLSWVDNRFGPVSHLTAIRQGGAQPFWWTYRAALSRPIGVHFANQESDAWGTSIDGSEALVKCLGEVLERYCLHSSGLTRPMEVLPAAESEFYDALPVCAAEEKCNRGFKGIQPDWLLTQTQVRDVATGVDHWLPAGYVCFSFYPADGEPNVTISHSTGAAFHETLLAAIWSGLCEVAERDALAMFWHNQVAPREILVDGSRCPYGLAERIERLASSGLQARFFDISSDFKVPAVFCIVKGPAYPFRTISAACGSDPVHLLSKCLDEVILVRSAQLGGQKSVNVRSTTEFEWVRGLRDHSDLYAVWDDTPAFDFMTADDREVIGLEEFAGCQWWQRPADFGELRERCRQLKEELGWDVLYADLTLDDARDLGCCVKVVVPQMVPINVPETAKWLATPRLKTHAERHGTKPGINPFPHPFP